MTGKKPTTEEIVWALGFAQPAIKAKAGANACILATRIAVDVLRHHHVRVQPVAVHVEILNPAHVERDTAWAMSEENVEIVRRSVDAYNRGDLDGIVENWAPDAVLDWSASRGVEAGVYRGHGEIRAFAQRFLAAWDEVRLEIDDPVEVEGDLLVAENVTYLRGRDGIEVQARAAWLITFRDGEQTSLTLYQTKKEALEAAGLRE